MKYIISILITISGVGLIYGGIRMAIRLIREKKEEKRKQMWDT